jgi:PII-like signaling protein
MNEAPGGPAVLLRVYVGEDEHHDGRPLYEAIVLRGRERGLAGATVLRGPLGYGHESRIRTTKLFELSRDLPVVVELVDTRERIEAFAREVRSMLRGGLVVLQDVRILSGEG